MNVLENLIKFIEKEGKVELSEGFKGKLEDAIKVATVDKETEIEGLKDILKEAKEEIESGRSELQTLKESTLEDVKKEIEAHKEALVEKVSGYLESELQNLVPENLVEAQAKVEAYEPIVEKVKGVFKGYGVEIDSEAHSVLKEAKEEILGLQKSYDTIVADKLKLEEKTAALLAKYVLKEKCDGLTEAQTAKINVIFKGSDVEEIEEKFESVADLIISEGSSAGDDTDGKDGADGAGSGSDSIDESAGGSDMLEEGEDDLGQNLL